MDTLINLAATVSVDPRLVTRVRSNANGGREGNTTRRDKRKAGNTTQAGYRRRHEKQPKYIGSEGRTCRPINTNAQTRTHTETHTNTYKHSHIRGPNTDVCGDPNLENNCEMFTFLKHFRAR